jgi:hypothetical protein
VTHWLAALALHRPLVGENTMSLMTKKTKSSTKVGKSKLDIEREIGEGALGAVAGATVGSIAGPPGAVVGAVLGAAAGVIAGAAVVKDEHRREEEDRKLDEEIGVTAGSLGAPNLKHPPPRHGLYSAAAAGAGSSGPSRAPASGPISGDGEE